MIYGIKDVTNDKLVSVFLAKNDITAIRMNSIHGEENNSPLRRGFNLVKVIDVGDDEPKCENLCRLIDCENELSIRLEKEGL